MSIAQPGHGPLDYNPVQYAGSPMRFRGPAQDLTQPYVLCVGGSETFGKFVSTPYPAQLTTRLGRPVVNMGAVNASLDLVLHDPAIGKAMARADAVVLQIMGTQNMTNRFYQVHPRRNDRVLKVSKLLKTIYREVEFTDFHFTRHMLTTLQSISQERFSILVDELQEAWTGRMRQILRMIHCPVHLLWIADRMPDDPIPSGTLGTDPLFVTAKMLDELVEDVSTITVCASTPEERQAPTRDMFFATSEEPAARSMPGPSVHDRTAEALAKLLS